MKICEDILTTLNWNEIRINFHIDVHHRINFQIFEREVPKLLLQTYTAEIRLIMHGQFACREQLHFIFNYYSVHTRSLGEFTPNPHSPLPYESTRTLRVSKLLQILTILRILRSHVRYSIGKFTGTGCSRYGY